MISAKIKSWLMLPALLLAGIAIGMVIPFSQIRNALASVFEIERPDSPEPAAQADQKLNVEVTETAQKSLGLKVRRVALGDYTATYDIPATIRELPGAGSITISSRYHGLVKKVFVSEGQSVRTGDPLFQVELTGESLAEVQGEYLLALQRVENFQTELDRLEPLIRQGGLANKRSLELKYEQKQVQAEIKAKYQELLLLGLDHEQVDSIQTSGQLIREVTVVVPDDLLPPQINFSLDPQSFEEPTFILESVSSLAGTVVESGAKLCVLAFHEILLVEGQAFEKDLPQIKDVIDTQREIAVSVGAFSNLSKVEKCRIAFVNNHARETTNTYPFFVYLENEPQGNLGQKTPCYLAWKWKPGQLAHVELPRKNYQEMLILPREAVAENGMSRVVFQWNGQVDHDHEHHPNDNHEHSDEYIPVEVNVLYMDREVAVIDPNGNLKEGTRIAYNNANQLLFSMQSGSGGHGHSHPHPH